ncbi:Regulator of competence-specific genes [uncultured Ruminococcus sp.]|uniref:TfoX/Sxy family protein n=1 Tax=Massiliimalia timonensis TaxID=1987501 RepID=UPI0008209A0A|nr:TfoX/Sxy family protein [Massiliimalia timonensis]MBS7175825.1 competence protein TfoX [Clostridiales bacterium]SCG94516.1 Regulator of competence-specific genes [uncultured Clostridium sp.]SCH90324.1 Regulator of competence-specific genes [uncultured Ruminococcus sp.]
MATSKEYCQFILEQLSDTDGITCRPMMGEYLIYCCGKLVGGIYDNRFMVKPVACAKAMLPQNVLEEPYPGAKPMLVVEDVENKAFLSALVRAMYPELPEPKAKKKK